MNMVHFKPLRLVVKLKLSKRPRFIQRLQTFQRF